MLVDKFTSNYLACDGLCIYEPSFLRFQLIEFGKIFPSFYFSFGMALQDSCNQCGMWSILFWDKESVLLCSFFVQKIFL